MNLGRVIGTAVATVKSPGLDSYKLLLVRDFNASPEETSDVDADYYVAIDTVGAGIGEVVLIAKGSAARLSSGPLEAPVDATIVAILDNVRIGSEFVFQRR